MKSKLLKMTATKKAALGFALVTATGVALAGAGAANADNTFDQALGLLTSFLEGSLGKLVATAMFIVGIVMGVMKQSIMAAVPTVAAAIAMAMAPTLIEAVFVAPLPF